jgi:hypothetical protein
MGAVDSFRAILEALRGKERIREEHLEQIKGESGNDVMKHYITQQSWNVRVNRILYATMVIVLIISYFF